MCELGDRSSTDGFAAELSGDTTVSEPKRSDCQAAPNTKGRRGRSAVLGTAVERLSRYSMPVLPGSGAPSRRSRLQRQQEVFDTGSLHRPSAEAPERGSLTPAMRKKYLKKLLLNNPSNSGFSSVLSSETSSASSRDELDAQTTDWALYPVEHAWMLCAVDGNYETILEFISEDPHLLTRKDFVSGFSVLHWLAKKGQGETLIKLLKYAETKGIAMNVDLRGSGGLTPLHVATMHGQNMVIKVLVGAFGANTDAMDYNGKRAWQYLKGDAPPEMKELLGAWDENSGGCQQNVNNNSATHLPACEEEGEGGRNEVDCQDGTARSGSWRLGSFKKLFQPFAFFNKS
ncbi:ankyrin repeat domain-containing protein SOWAHD [Lampris incognitus]|uniref:ankyrin repeat domain-containing protein SOWAHD n=1 Tax=Lampris incognitus TaxID=2546036 RepID=UPI0024B5465E|nr:ankyrin repeat domain-containing protein SOWAHD [Lampris incognitus]